MMSRRFVAVLLTSLYGMVPAVATGMPLVGDAQLALHSAGVISTLQPNWSTRELPWLEALNTPGVMAELLAVATGAVDVFNPNWDPSAISNGTHDWLALPLLNKGKLQPGCSLVPTTCAVLQELRHYLQPRPPAAMEVGVRILKLQPGGRLRQHHGPGGIYICKHCPHDPLPSLFPGTCTCACVRVGACMHVWVYAVI
jgi:hypothetical protein